MNHSPQTSHNPPPGKPLGGNGGEDPPQSGSVNTRHHQQISPVTFFPEKDNPGDNQTSPENSRRRRQRASPATFLPENHSPDNQTIHQNSYHHHQQQQQQASPGAVLTENDNTDNQSSRKNSCHNQQLQQASPATVLPETGIPQNQSSKRNFQQQHQSSQSGQVPPGFDRSLIQERSVVEEQLSESEYPPKATLTPSNPPINSNSHEKKTNIVNGIGGSHGHDHGPKPNAQPRARLPKPAGYPNKSPHPEPPKKRCLEKIFPCCF